MGPELELRVHEGADLPQGAVNLSSKQAQLDMLYETAAGDPSYYPGNDHAYINTFLTMSIKT